MKIRSHPKTSKPESGVVLLWAIFAAFVLISSSFIAATMAGASAKRSDLNRNKIQADYLALAATNHATRVIYESVKASTDPPAEGTVTIGDLQVDYTITQVDFAVGSSESGLNRVEYTYHVEGLADVGNSHERVRRVVRADLVPLFQFALFYEGDMEFLYPAPMEVDGPIHANGDIYVYAQNGLKFNTNHMKTAGGIYNRAHYSNWTSSLYNWGVNNPAEIRRWVVDPFDSSEPVEYSDLETKSQLNWRGIPSDSGFDSDFGGYDSNGDGDYYDTFDWLPFGPRAREQYGEPDFYADGSGSTLQTTTHGVQTVDTPDVESWAMFVADDKGDYIYNGTTGEYSEVASGSGTHSKGPFHGNADLTIISYPDFTWKAFNSQGIDVTDDLEDADVVSVTTTYDARQADGNGEKIQMTVIDVGELGDSGYFPENGLLYVAGYGAGEGTDVKGFQLTEGEELHGNLSVVSPDSIYVQGDYNTVAKKSASVMADAVNLLSNSWDNDKSPGSLPTASSTTYNLAILTRDIPTDANTFNGGPQNLPRFHEYWSGRTARIVGSLVCLGTSTKATGAFKVGGDYYKPPNRKWSYDEDFNSIDSLPPFTPTYVDVVDVAIW